ncbi:sulfotransferase 2B1-like [Boleophthalmus pectinirostris]|uniref:sulfotransferase 2B1-like n=1 Tax=Boleophthalmus pectinirostris TaxID=150288 RepID=UPI00242CF074|nr:sulfotransferase 2B1-like [Boleophthalmus pectinirostris]
MVDPNFYTLYQGMHVPSFFFTPESLKYWEDFTFRPDDVIVATYPKSGTNWAMEMVPLVLSGGDSSLVDSVAAWERSAGIGHVYALGRDLENKPSPRFFATHYHYHALPKSFYQVKPKVINVMRNPKDVLISAFHFYNSVEFHSNPGTLTEFFHNFLQGNVAFNSWFEHVKGWLNAEDKSHILYLTFEEMLQDLPQVVRRTAEFLEKPLDEEQVDRIADRCLFKNMKKHNHKVTAGLDHSKFYRKGIAGDWKNHLSEEEVQHFDSVYKEKMKDVDFKFPWD